MEQWDKFKMLKGKNLQEVFNSKIIIQNWRIDEGSNHQ